jgi:hypothetical protein
MPAPKRPNYFQSQFLVVRDFKDEQAYHEEMLRRHNRLMHDWGVVRDGLQVTKPAKPGDNFTISAGSAIDSLGREIVLEPKIDSVPQTWALGADKVQAARDTAGSQDVSITIAFQETDSDDPLDKYPPPGGQDNVTRQMQVPLIAATKTPAIDVVVLAVVKANGDVDNSVRKLANGFIGVSGSNDLCIGPNRKVGIGTISPQAPLHVKGDAAILNLEGKTHGFVQFYPKGFDGGRKGWLGYGNAGDSHLRINNEATGNVLISSLNGFVGVVGSGGDGQGIQFGNREIKFRGDKIQHFSIFANKVSNALTFAKSGSTDNMDTADGTIMTLADSGNVGIGTTAPKDQLQIGAGYSTIAISPMPADTPGTMFTNDYGSAYLGFNAVRTSTGKWRRETKSGTLNGGSMIYGTVEGKLCFVTLEPALAQDFEFTDIAARRRMVIDATGNVSITKDLTVTGGLSVTNQISALNGVQLNAQPLNLKGDATSGLRYFGAGAGAGDVGGPFAFDGPALYGYSGGALGTWRPENDKKKVTLFWNDSGNVGIGTTDPQAKLVVQQGSGAMTAAQVRSMFDAGKDGLQLDLNFAEYLPGDVLTNIDFSPKKKNAKRTGHVTYESDDTFGTCSGFYPVMGNIPAGYLTVPDLNADYSTGLTIEAWVQFRSKSDWARIIDFGNVAVGGAGSNNIFLTTVTGRPYIGVYQGASAQQLTTSDQTYNLPLNQWLHLAATIDKGRNATLYLGGQVINTGSIWLPNTVARQSNYIGKSNWSNDPAFDGWMASLRIYNRALTPSEIRADMDNDSMSASAFGVTADMIKKYSAGKAVFISGNIGGGRKLDGGLEVRHASLGQGIGLGYNTIYATGNRANQDLTIQAKGSGNLNLNPDSGNVGIGTDRPAALLTLVSRFAAARTVTGQMNLIGNTLTGWPEATKPAAGTHLKLDGWVNEGLLQGFQSNLVTVSTATSPDQGTILLDGTTGWSMGQITVYVMADDKPLLDVKGTDGASVFKVTLGGIFKAGGAFKIDHPLDPANKYLYHSFVESPDMKNIYDGIAVLDSRGEAVVELPEWFEALNRDFRYQLTAVSASAPNLYLQSEVADGCFKIAGGSAGLKVCWQVTGIRQDAYANAHRIRVEEIKPEGERGRYLHPEAFGQPPDKAISLSDGDEPDDSSSQER